MMADDDDAEAADGGGVKLQSEWSCPRLPTDYSDPVSGHLALLRIQRRLDLDSI